MEKSEAVERISLLMKYSAKSGVYTSQAQKSILRNFTLDQQEEVITEVMKLNGPLFAPTAVREQVQELAQELRGAK